MSKSAPASPWNTDTTIHMQELRQVGPVTYQLDYYIDSISKRILGLSMSLSTGHSFGDVLSPNHNRIWEALERVDLDPELRNDIFNDILGTFNVKQLRYFF